MNKTLKKILESKPVASLINLSKKLVVPGFDKMPLFDVLVFFVKGLQKSSITQRASSIAFHFFLAMFPAIIFVFTLLPYVPIPDFQHTFMGLLKDLMPDNAYQTIESTIEDIISKPRGGLLSLGFLMALYFSTNAVSSIMEAFNSTYHTIETRNWFRQRLISLILTVVITIFIIVGTALIIGGTNFLRFLTHEGILRGGITIIAIQAGKWLIILAMFFFGISTLYYAAPAKRRQFRFISAGSSLASLLIIVTSLGFNWYIENFSRYNALYGSIGTIIIVLLYVYFNAIVLLIGFELNASIHSAKNKSSKT